MSTLTVPPVLPSPREDAKKLHKAFKGGEFYEQIKKHATCLF